MLLSRRFLRVIPNPFAAPLDHEGRPCAAVQYDPEHSRFVRYIGAERREKLIEKRPAGDARHDRVEVLWFFDVVQVAIEDTGYHRERIKAGELLAADESTAKRAGFKELGNAAAALLAGCTARLTEWTREHDDELPASLKTWFTGKAPLVTNWPHGLAPADPATKENAPASAGGDA